MPLAEIAAVAGILGNATNIIDKIFSRFLRERPGKRHPKVTFRKTRPSSSTSRARKLW
jgi:hypothetical protein